jgi:hypothetical protein
MNGSSNIVDGTVFAFQIAFIRKDNGSEDRSLPTEKDRSDAKCGKFDK